MRDPHTGFARLTPDERRTVAASGGRAAHAYGKAHQWTLDEARAAGRLGGLVRAWRAVQARQAKAALARPGGAGVVEP